MKTRYKLVYQGAVYTGTLAELIQYGFPTVIYDYLLSMQLGRYNNVYEHLGCACENFELHLLDDFRMADFISSFDLFTATPSAEIVNAVRHALAVSSHNVPSQTDIVRLALINSFATFITK